MPSPVDSLCAEFLERSAPHMKSTLRRPRTGMPSTFTSSSLATGSSIPSSVSPLAKLPSLVKGDRHGRQSTAARVDYPFADVNEEDSIAGELALAPLTLQGNTNAGARHRGTTAAPTRGAPIAAPTAALKCALPEEDGVVNKARRHIHGECLSHPHGGCNCDAVQRPTMDQHAMWIVMAGRFKSVHAKEEPSFQSPTLCAPLPTCTNAPHARHVKPRIPRRASTPLVEGPWEQARYTKPPIPHRATAERRTKSVEKPKSVEKVLARHLARTSGPAVLAVPARMARRASK
ncbi:hypothetical protein T484DRAFT_1904102 [Baffinella frigidus]|nr:hypothetical protein T484DRAFT_1904102 [Cryptophyta sp. CCMP2293]